MAYILHFTVKGRRSTHPCRSLKDAVWEAWTMLENGEGDPDYVADEQGQIVLAHDALLQQVSEKDER